MPEAGLTFCLTVTYAAHLLLVNSCTYTLVSSPLITRLFHYFSRNSWPVFPLQLPCLQWHFLHSKLFLGWCSPLQPLPATSPTSHQGQWILFLALLINCVENPLELQSWFLNKSLKILSPQSWCLSLCLWTFSLFQFLVEIFVIW